MRYLQTLCVMVVVTILLLEGVALWQANRHYQQQVEGIKQLEHHILSLYVEKLELESQLQKLSKP